MDKVEIYKMIRSEIPGDADDWMVRNTGVERQTVRVWNMLNPMRMPSDANLRLMANLLDIDVDSLQT